MKQSNTRRTAVERKSNRRCNHRMKPALFECRVMSAAWWQRRWACPCHLAFCRRRRRLVRMLLLLLLLLLLILFLLSVTLRIRSVLLGVGLRSGIASGRRQTAVWSRGHYRPPGCRHWILDDDTAAYDRLLDGLDVVYTRWTRQHNARTGQQPWVGNTGLPASEGWQEAWQPSPK